MYYLKSPTQNSYPDQFLQCTFSGNLSCLNAEGTLDKQHFQNLYPTLIEAKVIHHCKFH